MLFALVAGLAIWLAFKMPRGAMHRVVNSTLHTSGQFAIRVVFLILSALVALSIVLDLDLLLGAFTAGIVWRLLMRDADESDRKAVESKVEAVAFGFLVPVFFIYTGVTFDLAALLEDPLLLAVVPLVLVLLFLVRGLPSMLAAPLGSSRRQRLSVAFLGATGLPIIVAVTAIGVSEDVLSTADAAVLVGAGMLSVLLFPLIAMSLRGERSVRATRAARGRSGVSIGSMLDDARARLADAPREALGELIVPRRVLGVGRSPRIVRRGSAWHLGVLLLTDDALLATGDIVRARAGGPARVRGRIAAPPRRACGGRATRRHRRGRERPHRLGRTRPRRGRSGRGIRAPRPA